MTVAWLDSTGSTGRGSALCCRGDRNTLMDDAGDEDPRGTREVAGSDARTWRAIPASPLTPPAYSANDLASLSSSASLAAVRPPSAISSHSPAIASYVLAMSCLKRRSISASARDSASLRLATSCLAQPER